MSQRGSYEAFPTSDLWAFLVYLFIYRFVKHLFLALGVVLYLDSVQCNKVLVLLFCIWSIVSFFFSFHRKILYQ